MENSMEVPWKTKNRIAIWSTNPTLWYIFRENHNLKRHLHSNVHSSTTIARTRRQLKCWSTEEWIKMWYIHTMEYYSDIKMNKILICRDMDGPQEHHTEWSKSEKKKKTQISSIKAYIWNLEKWYRWPYLRSRNRDTSIESKCISTKGEGGVGWVGRLGLTYNTLWMLYIK